MSRKICVNCGTELIKTTKEWSISAPAKDRMLQNGVSKVETFVCQKCGLISSYAVDPSKFDLR